MVEVMDEADAISGTGGLHPAPEDVLDVSAPRSPASSSEWCRGPSVHDARGGCDRQQSGTGGERAFRDPDGGRSPHALRTLATSARVGSKLEAPQLAGAPHAFAKADEASVNSGVAPREAAHPVEVQAGMRRVLGPLHGPTVTVPNPGHPSRFRS